MAARVGAVAGHGQTTACQGLTIAVMHPLESSGPVLCLAGPTASGKTGAAIALAKAMSSTARIEIISVDSALVYRGMDIGTAKPSIEERSGIAHHLIDIRGPQQPYSAAEFCRDTQGLVRDIHARGGLPLLVGGTMMYFNALLRGLDALPPADAATRAQLQDELSVHGIASLHHQLAQIDPPTAARLAVGDTQRILRALEVFRLTGQPLSSLHTSAQRAPLRTSALPLLSLEPADRSWLHERIAQRFAQMLQQGFLEEVRRLRQLPELHADLPSMRCVGYRQAWEALQAHPHQPDPAWVERAVIATRQLAKRQLTWLRSMPERHSLACDRLPQPQLQAQVKAWACSALARWDAEPR
jgi:tRNA dimethylallyltransferase